MNAVPQVYAVDGKLCADFTLSKDQTADFEVNGVHVLATPMPHGFRLCILYRPPNEASE